MAETLEKPTITSADERLHDRVAAGAPPFAHTGSGKTVSGRAVAINLVLAILLGTCISAWFLYHTDYFPEIGTVLALGGIFSWLAFVSKLLTEDRVKTIQHGFESHALGRWWLTGVLLVLWAGASYAGAQFGSVRVTSVEEAAERSVYFAARDTDFGKDLERLKIAGQITKVFRTPLFGSSALKVKIKGYPEKQTSVSWLHREDLRVPSDFLRPAILLRPSLNLLELRNHKLRIRVEVGDVEYGRTEFDGSALWLGCAADVEVPSYYQALWRAELQARQDLLGYVLFPKLLSTRPLAEGADVTVTIVTAQGNAWGKPKTIKVLPVRRTEDFPQVLVLEPDIQSDPQTNTQ